MYLFLRSCLRVRKSVRTSTNVSVRECDFICVHAYASECVYLHTCFYTFMCIYVSLCPCTHVLCAYLCMNVCLSGFCLCVCFCKLLRMRVCSHVSSYL